MNTWEIPKSAELECERGVKSDDAREKEEANEGEEEKEGEKEGNGEREKDGEDNEESERESERAGEREGEKEYYLGIRIFGVCVLTMLMGACLSGMLVYIDSRRGYPNREERERVRVRVRVRKRE